MGKPGSGLWSKQMPNIPHLGQGQHGVLGEVGDLRRDILKVLAPLAAIAVEEFLLPIAASTTAIQAATATVVAGVTYTTAAAQLNDLSGTTFLLGARNLTFTTAGTTPSHAPASATIVGFDAAGNAQTETVTPATTAATAAGVKGWSKITSVTFGVAGGTDATVSIGFGVVLGLQLPPKNRAGGTATAVVPFKEYVGGAVLTTGTVDATNHTYTPATAPDGAHKYAVYYEFDATLTPDA